MVLKKHVKKMFRLAALEKYKVKKINSISFEIFTADLNFKAVIDKYGIFIGVRNLEYNKIELYKLKNFCNLMIECHNIPCNKII